MKDKKLMTMIGVALGEASALFMSQGDIRAGDMVMPTEELVKIALKLKEDIKKLYENENEATSDLREEDTEDSV